ncbi:ScbR family autoregulator-binding transcription factor [Streptomyces europaeiscabiei]|uniref:ScbR family autoregulator-binding transcription factor n=1 Tax=Streptomyces europaeiscabiei TaxID=146819 RepID=UPI0029A104E2|nr:ScbR family autoregulator-binding transcription factor [Streptomyces europaeiscabiei]MDX3620129.1 ScbR family autoregulator-binding transcription factor [Streptomyces europaeiscabiei]
MAKQDRAIRTRRTILLAAAKVFEDHGYQAATISQILTTAGVTKGALYFHFRSKEELALGVLDAQDSQFTVPHRPGKLQELVDVVMLHSHRLQTDPMVRASVRLAMDQMATGLDRTGPFLRWSSLVRELLEKAQTQGELLPHVEPARTADVIVGSFAGIQSMSQAISDYQDLMTRASELLRHLLPSLAQPSTIASLHLSTTRGATVYHEATRLLKEQPTQQHNQTPAPAPATAAAAAAATAAATAD